MQAQTKTENWCGVLQEVALPGTQGDPEAFLEAAVKFANEECWGTLSCALMVHPGLLLERLTARHGVQTPLLLAHIAFLSTN